MTEWPFVKEIWSFDELGSTSTVARSMVLSGSGELPFAVWARRQTRGRGQRQNAWWSDEGSLTFTLALDPAAYGLRLDQEPRLALATAVSLIEAVAALGLADPGVGVRWPNDVEIGARKIGGILPERVETEKGDRILIGVGFNVATRTDLAPPAVERMATSLSALQPEPLSPEAVPVFLAAFLRRFPIDLSRLAADDPGLAAEWARLDLLLGRPIRVALGPRTLLGTARGIDPQGALLVDDGREVHQLFGGQVLRDR
ncbi:MAG: biotin--[acetyl-CoA-carboxylase] ligase [Paludisphaera borealis]|uniref:biotin--[acetyl-CoA-carboxylase] ligase n=1 Tax=Paludisphaera borealis TaxID=1387353 RepID=UPI00284C1F87|nr:biotin--[acetyl-CoA-carboxylase] ligase [Paludisphaera borealis]MDR3621074.1 biotin--[acetyl-CoA-carboxylase] ligase [Paludisphaera borealis]